ncbi:TerB family tellurite resistance protein [Paraglaciecola sp.]|uniref:tellurite resistance TerB family protein n=1 Tax=Paraglaciecola sp. TaxID=1920173 RepID=UPI0030F42F4C
MLKNIQEWFKTQLEDKSASEESNTIELATAVLFYEVMRADREFTESEELSYRQQLVKHFSLSETDLQTLCNMTKVKAESAVDYQQFTKVLNDLYNPEQKRSILDSLWSLAYADHVLSPDEDYTIRKIADLLYIPHSQFIQSKLAIQPDKT